MLIRLAYIKSLGLGCPSVVIEWGRGGGGGGGGGRIPGVFPGAFPAKCVSGWCANTVMYKQMNRFASYKQLHALKDPSNRLYCDYQSYCLAR